MKDVRVFQCGPMEPLQNGLVVETVKGCAKSLLESLYIKRSQYDVP